VKARALPMPRPIVWAVEAYDKFWGESSVRAQPESQSQSPAHLQPIHHQQRYLKALVVILRKELLTYLALQPPKSDFQIPW